MFCVDGGADLNETSNNNNNMVLDIPHSSAPDGSLYAQVKKSPSPEHSPAPIVAHLTNGDTRSAPPPSAPAPYVLSPEKTPPLNKPRDGGKRPMDMRERMALDELLQGITGEGSSVANSTVQWKTPPPSPDNKVSELVGLIENGLKPPKPSSSPYPTSCYSLRSLY